VPQFFAVMSGRKTKGFEGPNRGQSKPLCIAFFYQSQQSGSAAEIGIGQLLKLGLLFLLVLVPLVFVRLRILLLATLLALLVLLVWVVFLQIVVLHTLLLLFVVHI